MYKIALIQNQSEMAHYGYADLRPLIDYEYTLFTSNNIEEISNYLSKNIFDAIIVGANALNDKTIREVFFSDDFKSKLQHFLENGKGLFLSHQLRVAQKKENFNFLPNKLNTITAIERPKNEKSIDGKLSFTDSSKNHICLLYPNRLSISDIEEKSKNYNNLPGLYWHYLTNIDFEFWDIIIEDSSYEKERTLLIISKESLPYRIVISSLTLDWQKQTEALKNFFTYIVEGRHNTAIVYDENNSNISFNYLLNVLKTQKFPFKEYIFNHSDKLTRLKDNLKNGVHTNILISQNIDEKNIYKKLIDEDIQKMMFDGKLIFSNITINELNLGEFSISGKQKSTLELLQNIELQVQKELIEGYIDGSFWGTAETLQTLESLKTSTLNYKKLINKVLTIANEHDKNGSYDEVFGVSCALLWLRATYEGKTSKNTIKSLEWIKNNIDSRDDREKAQAYAILIETGLAKNDDVLALKNIITNLDFKNLSEIDLIVYIKSIRLCSLYNYLEILLKQLKAKQKNGYWIDLATTSNAILNLADILYEIQHNDKLDYDNKLKIIIEDLMYGAIIYIQNELQNSLSNTKLATPYYWDGKASTTSKCIASLLKFDDLINIPIDEIVDFLTRKHRISTQISAGQTALSVLESQKNKIESLEKNINICEQKLDKEKRLSKKTKWLIALVFILLYLFSSVVYGIYIEKNSSFTDIFYNAFIKTWGSHLAIIALIFTALQVPWNRFFRNKNANNR